MTKIDDTLVERMMAFVGDCAATPPGGEVWGRSETLDAIVEAARALKGALPADPLEAEAWGIIADLEHDKYMFANRGQAHAAALAALRRARDGGAC